MNADWNSEVKNLLLAGLGAVAMTAEKSAELVEELVKKGELTVAQGKILNQELNLVQVLLLYLLHSLLTEGFLLKLLNKLLIEKVCNLYRIVFLYCGYRLRRTVFLERYVLKNH